MLAHSLDLIMGGKARPQIVRPGAERGLRRGRLRAARGPARRPRAGRDRRAAARGRERDRRSAAASSASGRTSAFVAGPLATAADLRALGSRLLAFYGQHEHRKLTLASAQLETLDGFAGDEHLERRRRYREAHAEVGAIERELAELREREGARERDLDLLRFELAEIEAAEPDPAEEAELAPERERLRHAEALRGAASEALAAVAGGRRGRRRRLGGASRSRRGRRCRRRRGSTRRSTSSPSAPAA